LPRITQAALPASLLFNLKTMKFTSVLLAGALCVAATSFTEAAKCGQAWGQCGSKDGYDNCCTDGYYCQPWDSGNVQCQQTPAKCEKIETNVDFYGNDLSTVYGIQPGDCCNKCAETKDCTAYTYINHRQGPSACYLKRAGTNKKPLDGAISGYVKGGKKFARKFKKQMRASGCSTPAWGKCGDQNGVSCCVDGQYCQPWNPGFYQCIKTPDGCSKQLTEIDFPGNDIGTARAGTGEECCQACKSNPKCQAYTFVNFNNNGPQCYLKSSAGDGKGVSKKGAVSGVRG